MKICFEQSGGFAGLLKGCELDAAELGKEARAGLEQLLAARKQRHAADAQTRDAFDYTIKVQDEGTSRAFSFGRGAVPEAVRPLLAELQKCARPIPLR